MKKELVTPLKEKLISFETAKLAKEKGFDIETKGFYNNGIFVNTGSEIGQYHSFHNGRPKINDDKICSAPTQSLLQKWLREVHNVSIKIDDYYTYSRVRFDYNICELGSQEDNPVGVFETYEEALEIGLQEALKQIKT